MTTSASGRKLTSACNGVTTLFPCPTCRNSGDLRVYLLDDAADGNDAGTLLVEGADYSVGGDLAAGTGTITTTTAYDTGQFIRRWRETSREQDVEIEANQGLPAATQEGVFDRLSLIDEELDDDISRCVRVPHGETLGAVPSLADRAGMFAGWDADGAFAALSGTGADSALRTDLAASTGAALLGVIASGAGAVARSAQSKLRDFRSIKDYGATGDGIANDDGALAAAPNKTFLPAGTYKSALAAALIAGVFVGHGQIKDASNNLRAPFFAVQSAAPSSNGDWDSIETAFNADLSKVFAAYEKRVTGAGSLGTPLTSYQENPGTAALLGYLYIGALAGHNQATASNDGRTLAHFWFGKVDNYGNGDASWATIRGYVDGAKAGATNFLAMPAITALNGTFRAGRDGTYLNWQEGNLETLTKDAAAVGTVININRGVGDTGGGLGAYTSCFRGQSKGSFAVDSVVSASGLFKVGLDLTPATWTSAKAGIAMALGTRTYLGSACSDFLKTTSYGGHYFEGHTSGYFNVVWNSVSALQVSDTFVKMPVLQAATAYADNAAAITGGVALGALYRTATGQLMIRYV